MPNWWTAIIKILGRMGHDLRDSNYIRQQGALKTAYNVLATNTQEGHLHIQKLNSSNCHLPQCSVD